MFRTLLRRGLQHADLDSILMVPMHHPTLEPVSLATYPVRIVPCSECVGHAEVVMVLPLGSVRIADLRSTHDLKALSVFLFTQGLGSPMVRYSIGGMVEDGASCLPNHTPARISVARRAISVIEVAARVANAANTLTERGIRLITLYLFKEMIETLDDLAFDLTPGSTLTVTAPLKVYREVHPGNIPLSTVMTPAAWEILASAAAVAVEYDGAAEERVSVQVTYDEERVTATLGHAAEPAGTEVVFTDLFRVELRE